MRTTTATYLLLSILTLALPFTSLGRPGDRASRQAGWAVTPVPSVVEGLSGMATVPGKGSGARLASFDDGYFTHPDGPVTGELRVCAIRVQFEPDTLATTWGDGSFMYTIPDSIDHDNWIIDRPPHDRQYFQDHLLAARNYFAVHSKNQLVLKGVLDENEGGDVYPLAPQASYQLPYPVWHINYGNDDEQRLNEKLVQLFSDAWTLADNDPDLDVSQYDVFIVFHAGAGNEFDTGFDLTPFDIPSVFISADDLAEYGDLPNGIPLNEGVVPAGIILPSTQRQPGVDVGLHGTVVAQLGFAMGLPHLYNTEDGQAGIGMFGLMDRGFGAFFGQIPIPPSPWSRIFMGWQTPVTVDASEVAGDTLHLPAYHLPDAWPDDIIPADRLAKLFRIPINEDEYYLAEARLRDPDDDSLTVAYDRDGREIRFNNEYEWEADEGFRVAVTFDDYDFDLPASGLLLWHIDDSVIERNYADDEVNNDPDRRGVRLVEGDGVNDIGEEYAFLQVGDGTEYGYVGDAFYQNNEYWEDTNRPLFNTEFSTNTAPASVSNGGGFTHITMTNFSAIGDTMRFVLSNGWTLPGFPRAITAESKPLALMAMNLDPSNDVVGEDGGRVLEIVGISGRGALHVWNADGSDYGVQPLYIPSFQGYSQSVVVPQPEGTGDDLYILNEAQLVRVGWNETLGAVETVRRDHDTFPFFALYPVGLSPSITAGTNWEGVTVMYVRQGSRNQYPPSIVYADRDLVTLDEVELDIDFSGDGAGNILAELYVLGADDGADPLVYAVVGSEGEVFALNPPGSNGSPVRVGSPVLNDDERFGDGVLVPDPRGVLAGSTTSGQASVLYLTTTHNRLYSLGLGWHPVAGPDDSATPLVVFHEHIAESDVDMERLRLRALDLDGDGLPEPALLGAGPAIYSLEPNALFSENSPILLSKRAGTPSGIGFWTNNLFDSDGDGNLEWMSLLIDDDQTRLAAYDITDGRLMPGFPLSVPGSRRAALTWITDLTPEHRGLELLVVTEDSSASDRYLLSAFGLPSASRTPGEAIWTGPFGNAANTRSFNPLAGQDTEVSYASERGEDAYIWPNPVLDEDIARIRVFTGGNGGAYVSAKIYDLAGREQLSARGASQGQGEVELPVDVSSLPSGVYVARVEVGGTVHTIRFAVVN